MTNNTAERALRGFAPGRKAGCAFSRLMTNQLANAETPALRAYHRAMLGKVVVWKKTIQLVGSKRILAGAVMGKDASRDNVRSFIRKWRTRHDSNV